jgi:hypothetical protein
MRDRSLSFWKRMLRFIREFNGGKVRFHTLVCRLAGAFDLAEIRDLDLARQWYGYFNPLEEADSEAWFEMEELDYEKIKSCLHQMEDFLLGLERNFLDSLPPPSPNRPVRKAER